MKVSAILGKICTWGQDDIDKGKRQGGRPNGQRMGDGVQAKGDESKRAKMASRVYGKKWKKKGPVRQKETLLCFDSCANKNTAG